MLATIFLGAALVNGRLPQLSLPELRGVMGKAGIFGDEEFIRQLFRYENRMFSLKVGEEHYSVPLEKENKMVLCQLDLAKQDIRFERERREQLGERRQELLRVVKSRVGVETMLGVFEDEEAVAGQLSFVEEEGVEAIMQGGRYCEGEVGSWRPPCGRWGC